MRIAAVTPSAAHVRRPDDRIGRMQPLVVDLGDRAYPIHIGPDLIGRPGHYTAHLDGRQILVVTDEAVASLYLAPLTRALGNREVASVVLPGGEANKTIDAATRILDELVERRFNRSAAVIALGGGVIGDIAGFAAAIYQRGIRCIQVPTTLLAQVDSSVGGKTGVNHPKGKNLIGAFHQPACVIADTGALATLGERELRAGLAEVIKYGVLWDEGFFDWIEGRLDGLLARDEGLLARAVRRSCEIKAEVVSRDEREAGVRARLNLGHTFGHAIEAGMAYGHWLHGEAVAAGIGMAADLATRMGWLPAAEAERVRRLIRRAGLPDRGPAALGPDTFLDLMARDKKALDGGIRLVLPRAIGDTVLTSAFDARALAETLEACRADIEPPFFA